VSCPAPQRSLEPWRGSALLPFGFFLPRLLPSFLGDGETPWEMLSKLPLLKEDEKIDIEFLFSLKL
jgi:hypothetical protein